MDIMDSGAVHSDDYDEVLHGDHTGPYRSRVSRRRRTRPVDPNHYHSWFEGARVVPGGCDKMCLIELNGGTYPVPRKIVRKISPDRGVFMHFKTFMSIFNKWSTAGF